MAKKAKARTGGSTKAGRSRSKPQKAKARRPVGKAAKATPRKAVIKAASKETTAVAAPAKKTRKAKCPLSKAELKKVRAMLLAKRHDLLGDMIAMEAEAHRSRDANSGDLSSMPTHLADLGTDNFEQEFTLGLLESERALLTEIDQALERIENRTYGICLGTGEPINKPRLMARPWAKYSIEYARLIEKGLAEPAEDEDKDENEDED